MWRRPRPGWASKGDPPGRSNGDTGILMKIYTPTETAKQAGNKYLGVLVAAKFARHMNDLPKERIIEKQMKLTTQSLEALVGGSLHYKISRRRRSEA